MTAKFSGPKTQVASLAKEDTDQAAFMPSKIATFAELLWVR